ncbi:hypothetical protein [Lysinibacillus capsici]|uniref:hypothetical protein n=1 Tax=Lysinibacillus capsici TaxID=2115968 RepID=UPI0034E403C3
MIRIKTPTKRIKDFHLSYFQKREIDKQFDFAISRQTNQEFIDFFSFLKERKTSILIGKPQKLEKIKGYIKKNFNEIYRGLFNLNTDESINTEVFKGLRDEIESIFDYKAFSVASTPLTQGVKWGAYGLVNKLKVQICPYCQRSFTSTIKGAGGKTRPVLDHFIDKAKHPYFSVSLYNLIPCCVVCNSSFKGSKDFSLRNNFHPYINGYQEKAVFYLKPSQGFDEDLTSILNGKYSVGIKSLESNNKSFTRRVLSSNEIFHLCELYDFNKIYIDDLVNQSRIYTPEFINELAKMDIFEGDLEVRLILSGIKKTNESYLYTSNDNYRVLNKLLHDISNDLGI